MRIRRKVFRFIARKLFKVPEGEVLPWYVLVIKFILFPLHSYCAMQNGIKYDIGTDIYIIEGIKYSRDLFMDWADGGMPTGQLFRIVRTSNGVFAIERVNERKENYESE